MKTRKWKCIMSLAIVWIMFLSAFPVLAATTLSTPDGLKWENGFLASWNPVENASGYNIRLYYGTRFIKTLETEQTEFDFTPHALAGGSYYMFSVTAMGDGVNYTDSARSKNSDKLSVRGTSGSMQEIYVDAQKGDDLGAGTEEDPFRTIERARGRVDAFHSSATKDVTIYLKGSFYYGEEPLYGYTTTRTNDIPNTAKKVVDTYDVKTALTFLPTDNLGNDKHLTIKNWPGEAPVISGGKRIDGWTVHDAEKNIWKTNVGTDERARKARQLYINGKRAIRARSHSIPEGAQFSNGVQYVGTEAGLQNWERLDDVEFIYYRKWCSYRVGVQSVTENTTLGNYAVSFDPYAWEFAIQSNSSKTEVTETSDLEYIENAYELLDTPGEFYINRHTGDVFYIPRQGEDIEAAKAVVPVVDELVYAKGESTVNRVKNLTFDGIAFTDTTWLRPSGAMGHLSNQSDASRHEGKFYEGTINATAVENVNIKNCTIKNAGNMGIMYERRVKNCSLVGNVIQDTAGTGVLMVDPAKGYGGNADVEADAGEKNENILIANNYIRNIGLDFPSAAGLVGGRLCDSRITHNEIYECTYTGISMGWHSGADKVEVGNVLSYNIVRDVLTAGIDDGGNFYHLGPTAGNEETPGWMIRENYFTGTYGTVSPMYSDNSSSWLVYEKNVSSTKYSIDDTKIRAGFTQGGSNRANYNTYRNNYYSNGRFYDSGDKVWIDGDKITTYNTYVGNVKCPMDAWPEEALTIIANAGLEPAYRHIRTEKENLITDGSFEHTKTAYAMPWVPDTNTKIERNSAHFTDGAYGGKITLGGSGSSISQTMRLDSSKRYRFTVKVKSVKPDTSVNVSVKRDGVTTVLLTKPVSNEVFTDCAVDVLPTKDASSLDLSSFTISLSKNNYTGDVFYVDECVLYETEEDSAELSVTEGVAKAEYCGAAKDRSLMMSLAVYQPDGRIRYVDYEVFSVKTGETAAKSISLPKTETGETVKIFLWDHDSLAPVTKEKTITIS
ncbi:MAG: right-handed parallel beta-helix repeat-containing protein [Clostridia bacterium]|nr:right-handed parallel beta-helix repeat-containing protein [Clostridia bacterium]